MCKKLHYFLSLVLMLIMIANSNAQIDPGTENLTHSWTFNDDTENDYVGEANGTLMGDAYISNGSLFTDLPNSWMEMPADIIAINTYNEVTIEAWFVPSDSLNIDFTMIAYFGNTVGTFGTDYFFFAAAREDNVSRTAISCGNQSTPWSAESGANGPELDDGALHHMVSTLSDTNITLYIDGVLKASTPLGTNNSIAGISPTFAYLAKGGYTSDPIWLGEILEFNIYNKALDSNEVLFLYNKGAIPTSVDDESTMSPNKYSLSQNYPNPFNPKTIINYQLPVSNFVTLKVFDMLGREVATLINEEKARGNYSVEFDGTNYSSGVYFYRIQAGSFVATKKFVLMK